jgi:S1-C subfamily serine protease
LSWRTDDAEPGSLVVTRVVSGSPAELAGLQVADRVLEIGGRTFANGEEFQHLVAAMTSPIELTRERMGQIRTLKLEIPAEQGVFSAHAGPTLRRRR